ncbi:MAG: DsbA family oxidoreductase [Alphaproteobacteria bacterium]
MKIDVLSDPVCPWCYIGKVRFEQALKSYSRDLGDIEFIWRIFQLNPDMPAEGMDRKTYLERKFGGPEGAQQVYGNIQKAGAEVGINFNFDAIKTTPNTLKAHRLIRLATTEGKGQEVKDLMFKAYFEDGLDIGNTNELAFIAHQCGMDRDKVTAFLMGNDFAQELMQEDQAARQAGVTGVPFFIIDDKYVLSGAQPAEAFHKIFDLALTANQGS